MKVKLPADLESKFELVGDDSTLGNVLDDPAFGVIDIRILTKELAQSLVKAGRGWIKEKTALPVTKAKSE